jgi:hypothetical protein
MNKKLSFECKQHGFIFIDLFNKYSDKDGFLRKDMSDGGPHIKNIEPLVDFIYKNFIKQENKNEYT